MRIAIYDLDGTLTKRATYTPFLIFAARKLAPIRLILLPVWIAAMIGYRIGLYDRRALKQAGMRLMIGEVPLERLDEVGADFARHHIAQSGWNDSVLALLEQDRAAGATLVIATAAYEFYARSFAAALSIDHVIGTVWNGREIEGGNCYGDEKELRVDAWLESQHLGSGDAEMRFVSDSFADKPMLRQADDPIFVTNSKRAAARAQAEGWRVVNAR